MAEESWRIEGDHELVIRTPYGSNGATVKEIRELFPMVGGPISSGPANKFTRWLTATGHHIISLRTPHLENETEQEWQARHEGKVGELKSEFPADFDLSSPGPVSH